MARWPRLPLAASWPDGVGQSTRLFCDPLRASSCWTGMIIWELRCGRRWCLWLTDITSRRQAAGSRGANNLLAAAGGVLACVLQDYGGFLVRRAPANSTHLNYTNPKRLDGKSGAR